MIPDIKISRKGYCKTIWVRTPVLAMKKNEVTNTAKIERAEMNDTRLESNNFLITLAELFA